MKKRTHLTDTQKDLRDCMSEISEDRYCARWMCGNEYDIWAAIQNGPAAVVGPSMHPKLLRRCKLLSEEIGGWIYWADEHTDTDFPIEAGGAKFVPMARWLAMVSERSKLAESQQP